MTIHNAIFETDLDTRECIEAVRKNGSKAEGILLRPFSVAFTWKGNRWRLTIPEGYAAAPSVPSWLRSFMPATGAIRWASFPHDWMYEHRVLPRKDADDLMAELMKVGGDGMIRRTWAWGAVRLGGWLPWRKHEGDTTLKGMEKIVQK